MNYGKSQQAIFLFTGNNKKAPFSFFIAVSRSLAKIEAQTPLYLPRCHLSYLSLQIGCHRGGKAQTKDLHIS